MHPLLHVQPSLDGPDMLGEKIKRKQAEGASKFFEDAPVAEKE
jgi:hypothetical protein